jgi:hypothetical protein
MEKGEKELIHIFVKKMVNSDERGNEVLCRREGHGKRR